MSQVTSLQTRLRTLQSAVDRLEGADLTLAEQLDRYDTLFKELIKRKYVSLLSEH